MLVKKLIEKEEIFFCTKISINEFPDYHDFLSLLNPLISLLCLHVYYFFPIF